MAAGEEMIGEFPGKQRGDKSKDLRELAVRAGTTTPASCFDRNQAAAFGGGLAYAVIAARA
jgi:hypothetical protein